LLVMIFPNVRIASHKAYMNRESVILRVCVGEGCESERERELATKRERERERERGREGARGVVCVHEWRIDRETVLMFFESGLCKETKGRRVIVCVIGTSLDI